MGIQPERWILHVDMDAFYASIEQRDHREYLGKPVIIGAAPNVRGVVSTCSYEARKFGVHSAMPSRTAGKLCPHGIFIPPDMEKYRKESHAMMLILQQFAPQIEVISIDEAFLDVSSVLNLFGNAVKIAGAIKKRIWEERQLTTSVGVAPNKFLAKVASDLEKPDGLSLITDKNKLAILAPMPVEKIWGVGKVTAKLLNEKGFKTIGDLQTAKLVMLRSFLGHHADLLHQLAFGIDGREVEISTEQKSIGSENTFLEDTVDQVLIKKTLLSQAEEIAMELRRQNLGAHTISMKLRYSDFTTLTRQTTFAEATQDEIILYETALRLLSSEKIGKDRKVRLIGISASKLSTPSLQLELLDASVEKRRKLALAIDTIRAKHGQKAIRRLVE